MKKSIVIFIVLFSLTIFSSHAFCQTGVTKKFECNMEGCNISCITKSKGIVQINGARTIKMSSYPNGLTIFEAEIELGKKETITTGDSGVCKIEHRK